MPICQVYSFGTTCVFFLFSDSVNCIASDCKNFMEMFQEVAESQKKQEENEDASATAEALEKLSFGEEKSKDKAPEEKASPANETAALEEKASPAKETAAPAEETKAELKKDDVEKKSEDSSP